MWQFLWVTAAKPLWCFAPRITHQRLMLFHKNVIFKWHYHIDRWACLSNQSHLRVKDYLSESPSTLILMCCDQNSSFNTVSVTATPGICPKLLLCNGKPTKRQTASVIDVAWTNTMKYKGTDYLYYGDRLRSILFGWKSLGVCHWHHLRVLEANSFHALTQVRYV